MCHWTRYIDVCIFDVKVIIARIVCSVFESRELATIFWMTAQPAINFITETSLELLACIYALKKGELAMQEQKSFSKHFFINVIKVCFQVINFPLEKETFFLRFFCSRGSFGKSKSIFLNKIEIRDKYWLIITIYVRNF